MPMKDVRIRQPKKRSEPLWKGPEEDGITFSLLSRFLVCRERFRLLVVEGLSPADQFNHRIEYGQMWHTCEEAWASPVSHDNWKAHLQQYAKSLCRKYPTSQEQIDKWYEVCKLQFPLYCQYWEEHPDVVDRVPLVQERVFDVPYVLPSGRTVRLRGKCDSIDLIGKGKKANIYVFETKTKGDIVEEQLRRQLTFDLQTMLYLIAFKTAQDIYLDGAEHPVGLEGISGDILSSRKLAGVRYNVIRRPLSGGRGSIVQHKPTKNNPGETREDYYKRLAGIIGDDLGYFFMRWKVEVSEGDINTFCRQCLDPILEQLCDWWEWITGGPDPFSTNWQRGDSSGSLHWRHPFGVYNILDEGGSSDLDEYLATGSEAGLARRDSLFSELG